jgi:hypothetical protein
MIVATKYIFTSLTPRANATEEEDRGPTRREIFLPPAGSGFPLFRPPSK